MLLERFFFTFVEVGQSSATVKVVGGKSGEEIRYNCTVYREGGGGSTASVGVIDGENETVPVKIFDADFEAHVAYIRLLKAYTVRQLKAISLCSGFAGCYPDCTADISVTGTKVRSVAKRKKTRR